MPFDKEPQKHEVHPSYQKGDPWNCPKQVKKNLGKPLALSLSQLMSSWDFPLDCVMIIATFICPELDGVPSFGTLQGFSWD